MTSTAAEAGPLAADTQYSVPKILLIWAAATVPMAVLAWVAWPALRDHVSIAPGMLFWLLMIVGMVWQFVLSLLVLHGELGTLRWSVVGPRIWAQQPRDPRTGQRRPSLWWWMLPIIAVFAVLTVFDEVVVSAAMTALGLAPPDGTDTRQLADEQFVGQWWIMAVAFVSCAFNYLLGEELLFRGVLLPRMAGAFGRWDWVANNVLFTLYHVHKVWAMPGIFLTSLPFSWAARRYRTIWFSVVLHGLEGVALLVIIYTVLSGLAF